MISNALSASFHRLDHGRLLIVHPHQSHTLPNAEIARSDVSLDLRWCPLGELPEDSDFGFTQLIAAAQHRIR